MKSHSSSPLSRRRFVKTTAGAIATSAVGSSASAQSSVPDLPPYLTPADDFYTVARGNPKPHTLTGKALADARMTPETWRLEITTDPFVDEEPGIKAPARIENSLTLADGTALDLPALHALGKKHGVKYIKAMQCLNIAEPLGQGLWEGVPLREILRLCGKMENVRRIYYRGFHNNDPKQIFQSSVSYSQAMETPPGELPVFLAYRLNGETLTPVRGGPVRMVVPWAHGFKSIKWLRELFLTNDYRTNDTYALKNNDPESYLKTAAYVDGGPETIASNEAVTVHGRVISGRSGLNRVEYFLRPIEEGTRRLPDGAPGFEKAKWQPSDLAPQPDWKTALPASIDSRELLGFDSKTGKPLTWPTRYGMVSWTVTLQDLKPGKYELYARSVDLNGFAQPEPRSIQKSGKNAIQLHRFKVI